jgi:hypothetical protein
VILVVVILVVVVLAAIGNEKYSKNENLFNSAPFIWFLFYIVFSR